MIDARERWEQQVVDALHEYKRGHIVTWEVAGRITKALALFIDDAGMRANLDVDVDVLKQENDDNLRSALKWKGEVWELQEQSSAQADTIDRQDRYIEELQGQIHDLQEEWDVSKQEITIYSAFFSRISKMSMSERDITQERLFNALMECEQAHSALLSVDEEV